MLSRERSRVPKVIIIISFGIFQCDGLITPEKSATEPLNCELIFARKGKSNVCLLGYHFVEVANVPISVGMGII